MKNTINKLFVFFVALLLTNSMVAQEDFKLPEYTKIQLKNGLTIYLMERHEVPLIQFTAVFPAGAVNDTKDKSGLAAVTADALVLSKYFIWCRKRICLFGFIFYEKGSKSGNGYLKRCAFKSNVSYG